MKYIMFFIATSILLSSSCSKDSGKACWQGWDRLGQDATGYLFCDKTLAEAEAQAPGLWFYRQGETKYCWQSVNGSSTVYWVNMPESIKNKYVSEGYGSFTKIDCNSFCFCRWQEKHKSKITGLYNPTRVISENFFAADTCSKLFVGRIIIYRETTDSLITRELTSKQP